MTTQESSTPILTIDGPRADIRFNRPDKLNRIEPADLEALDRHLDAIEGDPSLRVVVLTGAGGCSARATTLAISTTSIPAPGPRPATRSISRRSRTASNGVRCRPSAG